MNQIVKDGESSLISKYKTQISELNKELYSLTEKLERITGREKEAKENVILIDPNIKYKKEEIKYKIEAVEKREQALIQEIDSAEQYYTYSLNKLRSEMEKLDKIIEKEVNYTQSYNYYHNDFNK
jgi:chromosome segregation ATPase